MQPLFERLENRGATHAGAVGGVFAAIALFVVGMVAIGGPLLLDQALAIVAALPQHLESLRDALLKVPNSLAVRIAWSIPAAPSVAPAETEVVDQAIAQVTQTLNYVGIGLRGVLGALAVVLLSFYWSLQYERTLRWVLLVVPPARREETRELVQAFQDKVGGYLRAQGILCGVVGLLCLVAYLIIGLPYAVLMAVAAGILEAVPYFGPILGAAPAVLVALSNDPSKVVWVIVASIIIQQIENHVLVPRVMDRSVGVNAVVTLLAIAGFGSLFGVAGAVLAIPMAAVLQLLLEHFVLSREALEPPEPAGRDQVSALRYQAQQLIYDVRIRTCARRSAPDGETEQIEEGIEEIARQIDVALAEVGREESLEGSRDAGAVDVGDSPRIPAETAGIRSSPDRPALASNAGLNRRQEGEP